MRGHCHSSRKKVNASTMKHKRCYSASSPMSRSRRSWNSCLHGVKVMTSWCSLYALANADKATHTENPFGCLCYGSKYQGKTVYVIA